MSSLTRRFSSAAVLRRAASGLLSVLTFAAALAADDAGRGSAAPATNGAASVEDLKRLSIEELMSVKVATVTAASRRPEKVADAPATVIVIDKSDIRLRGYSTLKDVLRDLPGMETVEYYFSEIGTLVPVRGIVGNNKIVVLVNGMRVNPPGGEYFPLRSDFSVRDAERIEVVYGPGSTLYGQDAISAVINVITQEPEEGRQGEAGVLGGMNSEQEAWGSFHHAFGKNGRSSLSGYVQYHDSQLSDLDRSYPGWWQDYEAASRKAEPAGLGLDPVREDYGLNLFARVQNEDSSLQVWHRESERSSSEGFSAGLGYLRQAKWEDSSTVVEGKHALELADEVALDSCITWNRYEIDPDTRYVFPVPAAGGKNEWFFNDYKYGLGTSFSVEETLRAEVSPTLSLIAGAVASTYDIIPKSTVPGGADPRHAVEAQGGSFVYFDDAGQRHEISRVVRERYETYAGYVEAGWQVLPRAKAILGTRVTSDTRFDDMPLTPRFALVFDVANNLTAKYIYTRAYVAPAPYFGFATFDNGTLLSTSNPDLQPEEASSHEVNINYGCENVNAGASVYYGKESDLIVNADRATPANIIDPSVRLPDGSTRKLVQYANAGSSRNYGADLYGRARFGNISPWCSYSYVDFQEEQDGMDMGLQGVSEHNGRLGATWAALSTLFVTPSLVVRSTPENVQAGHLEHELKTPYEVNLHVLYNATRNLDLFVNVRNLTNHKYALGGVTGAAVPQETFSATAGARLTF